MLLCMESSTPPRDTGRAMSQENIDRFLKFAAAFNRLAEGDTAALEEFMRFWDPEVRFEPQQAALEGGYSGHDGVRQWLADMGRHYESGQLQYPDIRDLEDRVLAIGTLRYTGRASGIETEAPVAVLASFRGGLVTRFKDYGDKDRALEAAGLSE